MRATAAKNSLKAMGPLKRFGDTEKLMCPWASTRIQIMRASMATQTAGPATHWYLRIVSMPRCRTNSCTTQRARKQIHPSGGSPRNPPVSPLFMLGQTARRRTMTPTEAR